MSIQEDWLLPNIKETMITKAILFLSYQLSNVFLTSTLFCVRLFFSNQLQIISSTTSSLLKSFKMKLSVAAKLYLSISPYSLKGKYLLTNSTIWSCYPLQFETSQILIKSSQSMLGAWINFIFYFWIEFECNYNCIYLLWCFIFELLKLFFKYLHH